LEFEPTLAEIRHSESRYDTACAAVLAGASPEDAKALMDEKTKVRWRKRALDWLKADLTHWTKQAETRKPEAKALVRQTLHHWKVDSDLASIRDKTPLETLPEDEQRASRALWAEVDALLAKAVAGTAP
jgi:hypothetical protein